LTCLSLIFLLTACAGVAEHAGKLDSEMVGGANSPAPSPPPRLVIQTGELSAGSFSVKVPTGSYTAPKGGAPNYSVPGPIVAFKGPDGVWRGHGYLETYPRLLSFAGKLSETSAQLTYNFEKGKSYRIRLLAKDGAILMEETSELGPRNVFVFDCYYGWLPSAGLALNRTGTRHAFLYLPCYYDKAEVTINPVGTARSQDQPGAVAVVSRDPSKKDVSGFWCRDVANWRNSDRMGIQLWQRRQLPGDPSSRHYLGPETKCDSTPNPRTAPLLGRSLYEGHVTIELNLGNGTRKLGFAVATKGPKKETIPEAFKKLVQANQ